RHANIDLPARDHRRPRIASRRERRRGALQHAGADLGRHRPASDLAADPPDRRRRPRRRPAHRPPRPRRPAAGTRRTAGRERRLAPSRAGRRLEKTHREEPRVMPKASKKTASRVEDMGIMEGRYEELGGYTVGFETFREDADATPLFKGLPDNRCQSPHWGYVAHGRVTFRFAEGDEVDEAGDASYAPPGHIPGIAAG